MSHANSIVCPDSKYAIMRWRTNDGGIWLLIYREHGRKLKHGKRRKPVAQVRLSCPGMCGRVYVWATLEPATGRLVFT